MVAIVGDHGGYRENMTTIRMDRLIKAVGAALDIVEQEKAWSDNASREAGGGTGRGDGVAAGNERTGVERRNELRTDA
jgi:hypothetical protein